MSIKISKSVLVVVSALLLGSWLGAKLWKSAGSVGAAPPATIPTFSTANIGRQGHFYVGGHYVGDPGKETMDAAMYVEVWVPKSAKRTYQLGTLLPRSLSEGLGRAIKADRVLADIDVTARRDYELRAAQSEPGLPPAPEQAQIPGRATQ